MNEVAHRKMSEEHAGDPADWPQLQGAERLSLFVSVHLPNSVFYNET